jgi:cyclic pyranopterin phosphate synthase
MFRLPGALGEVGFISSVTVPFCAACTRARLTADGRLRLCLLREGEVDLLKPLRLGATLEDLRQIILDGIWYKPWGHGLAEGIIPLNRVMSEIGG